METIFYVQCNVCHDEFVKNKNGAPRCPGCGNEEYTVYQIIEKGREDAK